MSDDLLKALGRVGREERAASQDAAAKAPEIDSLARERMVKLAFSELGASDAKPTQRSRRLPRALLASGLAIAAAVLLWMGTRHNELPSYELSVHGGTSEWRAPGDAGGARRLEVRSDGAIEIIVRPEQPVSRPIQARAFALRDGITKPLPVEVSPQGAARVVGPAADLLGASPIPADWTVIVVIGAAGDVPASLAEARAGSGLRVVEANVTITK